MYNRNSERIHRAYFVNLLYKNNLLDDGFISFLENPDFVDFLYKDKDYPELFLSESDILDIRDNYKNYYPLVIDDSNADRVSIYHNFLSRKDEYENSYFTIISETNAQTSYSFLTEKTIPSSSPTKVSTSFRAKTTAISSSCQTSARKSPNCKKKHSKKTPT